MERLLVPTLESLHVKQDFQLPKQIPQPFISKILTPYKPNVKYLLSASIEAINEMCGQNDWPKESRGLITGNGIFSIPSSCYIDDTGHFNSVEFNICFNQLAYVLFGNCFEADLFKKIIPSWYQKTDLSYEIFMKNQLSSMYIARIDGKFLKPMDSKKFFGQLILNRIICARKITFFETTISFSDDQGVKATGSVLLAYNSGTNK